MISEALRRAIADRNAQSERRAGQAIGPVGYSWPELSAASGSRSIRRPNSAENSQSCVKHAESPAALGIFRAKVNRSRSGTHEEDEEACLKKHQR
jgi:hypothetical protein